MSIPIKTFVIRDFAMTNLVMPLDGLQRFPPEGHLIEIPGLDARVQQGSVFKRYVSGKIEGASQVLALCDLPNANVGFELGYALGRGLAAVLASTESDLPDWITDRPPFRGFFVTRVTTREAMCKVLIDAAESPESRVVLPSKVEPGDATLVLCPVDHGETELLCVKATCRTWRELPRDPWNFADVPGLLRGVGRVVWIIPTVVGASPRERDGDASAALAIIAGVAHAVGGIELVVLRNSAAREVADVKDDEILYSDGTSLTKALAELRERPLRRSIARTSDSAPDPIDAYRTYLAVQFVAQSPFGYEVQDSGDCHVTLGVMKRIAESAGGDSKGSRRGRAPVKGSDDELAKDAFMGQSVVALDTLLANVAKRTPGDCGPGGVRWVLVAQPGAGKTTSARGLCRQLALEPNGPIPVFLPLPELLSGDGDPFERAARDADGSGHSIDEVVLARRLRELAGEPGRIWLILDAWDEVLRDRPKVEKRLTEWLRRFPKMSVLVTTRPTGYSGLPGFEHEATLKALDARQRTDMLERWLGAELRDELLVELERRPAVQLLSDNPLFLTFIAQVFTEDKCLPRTRGELYERTIELLLERGAARIGGEGSGEALTTRRLLEALSLELIQSGSTRWSLVELFETLGSLSRERGDGARRIRDWLLPWRSSPEAFLRDVADRSAILGPHDGPRRPWGFLHRTLGEYLGAYALHESGSKRVAKFFKSTQVNETSVEALGETLGLVVDLVKDEKECLSRLRQLHDIAPESFRRTIVQVDRPRPIEVARVLLASEAGEGDDLLALMDRWISTGEDLKSLAFELVELNADSERLGVLVDAVRERQAWIAYAVSTRAGLGGYWLDGWWTSFWESCALLQPLVAPPLDWCSVRAASFDMGGTMFDFEQPIHRVDVPAFELARTPVTRAQYVAFDPVKVGAKANDTPMVAVSWWESWLYCRWIGARLPSEAEWEYACRAGTTTEYWFGDDAKNLSKYAWFGENILGSTRPVGTKPANPLGLFDMHGNVWEWCEDYWHDDYKSAPNDGSAWVNRGDGYRVMRGGSWNYDATWCRSASRDWRHPSDRIDALGFRPARHH